MRSESGKLDSVVKEATQNGDLTIELLQVNYSTYDKGNIILGLNQLPTKAAIQSDLVMEICNA